MSISHDKANFKKILDELYQTYQLDYLSTDPLEIVRQYKNPEDQEIVGFIAAAMAFGRVELIKKGIYDILQKMGPSPYQFMLNFEPHIHGKLFDNIIYRFYSPRDIKLLIWWTAQMIEKKGSIKNFFLEKYDEKDENIGHSLSRFVRAILSLQTQPFYPTIPKKGHGIRFFLADPGDKSACKRLNLFLRWMVRRDRLDLGIFQEVSPSKLIIPLDTHVARISQRIGLTNRTTPNWSMAVEFTNALKELDSDDPIKYDFALCRVGMLNPCPEVPDNEKCSSCPLVEFCVK